MSWDWCFFSQVL